jgi:hypothetical protein
VDIVCGEWVGGALVMMSGSGRGGVFAKDRLFRCHQRFQVTEMKSVCVLIF